MSADAPKQGDFVKLSEMPLLKQLVKQNKPSATKLRLIEAAENLDNQTILYQHTVFCQVGLPYRDPGNILSWERRNGNILLEVNAGKALDPRQRAFVQVGLPFGPKPRLILADANTQAILTQSPEIDLEKSLSRYVKKMGLDTGGRTIRTIKDAMTRLSASSIRMGILKDGSAETINTNIIAKFDIWLNDATQKTIWPSTARFSLDYFNNLMAHAVPLNEDAYFALSHNSLAMDIYAWLAQRLHRIKASSALVTWPNLAMQFGWNYHRLDNFRKDFKTSLAQVKRVYPAANIQIHKGGLTLRNSPPPIVKTQIVQP